MMKIILAKPDTPPTYPLQRALSKYVSEGKPRTSAFWLRVGAKYSLGKAANPGSTQLYRITYTKGTVDFGIIYSLTHKHIVLHSLRADPIGKGLGRLALSKICKICDKHGTSIELSANPGHGSLLTLPQLIDWYVSFGFKPAKRRGNLIRIAQGD